MQSRSPRPRRANSGISSGAAALIAAGTGGLEELRDYLEDTAVSWALLRWEVGSGTFARSKLVAVHFNGDDVPVVRRGKLNARTREVLANLGEVHASIEVKRKEDFSVDFVCQRLLPLLTADAGMERSLSAEALRKEYEALMAQKRKSGSSPSGLKGARTARELATVISASKALRAVGDIAGVYNWLLLEPEKLELHNAGYGGLSELKEWLSDDMVLFGMVRFTFGRKLSTASQGAASACGLVKYVFIHWVGPSVSALKRGKWNAQLKTADDKVRKVCSITFRREAHGQEDLQLADLISELRRLAVLDGSAASDQMQQISVEEYMASLALEQQAQTEVETEDEARGVLPDMQDAVASVRRADGDLNWCLIGTQPRESQAATADGSRSQAEPAEASFLVTASATPSVSRGPPASPRKSLSPRPGLEHQEQRKSVTANDAPSVSRGPPASPRKSLSPRPGLEHQEQRKSVTANDAPSVSRGPPASPRKSLSPRPGLEHQEQRKSVTASDAPSVSRGPPASPRKSLSSPSGPPMGNDQPHGSRPVAHLHVPGRSLSPRPAEQNTQGNRLSSRPLTEPKIEPKAESQLSSPGVSAEQATDQQNMSQNSKGSWPAVQANGQHSQFSSRKSLPSSPAANEKETCSSASPGPALGPLQEPHCKSGTAVLAEQEEMLCRPLPPKPAEEHRVPCESLPSEPAKVTEVLSTAMAQEQNLLGVPQSSSPGATQTQPSEPAAHEQEVRIKSPPPGTAEHSPVPRRSVAELEGVASDKKQRLSHKQGCRVSFSHLGTEAPERRPGQHLLHRQSQRMSFTSLQVTSNSSEAVVQKTDSLEQAMPSTNKCEDDRAASSGTQIAATSENPLAESLGQSAEVPAGVDGPVYQHQTTDKTEQHLSHHKGYRRSISNLSTASAGDGVEPGLAHKVQLLPGQRAGIPRVSGSLQMKAGWGLWWARRHFELENGKFRWWRKAEDWKQRIPPTGEIRLADGEKQWVLWCHEATLVELRCHQRSKGSITDGMTAVGDRILLRADEKEAAQDWAEALQQHISYVEMLMVWPMPQEGRQGDIRYYGIEYPGGF
eukprot:TRINITY_DN9416_c0_g2_i1.p1 TRINITY_DN9416_c0_g2~~TRINITY_DN9416_c0_g2_i1.p1  ORF type:complete len:1068 (+),score=185.46 TRINITY_DN9416_c0_g2_i1:39-3242(+)